MMYRGYEVQDHKEMGWYCVILKIIGIVFILIKKVKIINGIYQK